MIEFIHFKMTHDSDLKTYYEKKRMLGFRASLTLDQIIPVMIDGLPMDIKSHFVSVQPTSLEEVFKIACNADMNRKRKFYVEPFYGSKRKFDNQTSTSFMKKPKFQKKKPPQPCSICTKKGFLNRYHWMSDCRNKDKDSKTLNS